MKEARAYGLYAHNELLFQTINKKIVEFWEALQSVKTGFLSLNDIPYAQGFHALCPFCHVNSDCPKFKTDAIQPQWEPSISRLDDLKQNRVLLDAQIKEIEAGLKQAASKFGMDSWINTEGHRAGHLTVENGNISFQYGPLALAMRYGGICLVNEIDLTSPEVAAGLNGILDGSPLCIAENGGELVKPHPMFRFAATANTNGGGDETGLYQGTQRQNIAFADRFMLCECVIQIKRLKRTCSSSGFRHCQRASATRWCNMPMKYASSLWGNQIQQAWSMPLKLHSPQGVCCVGVNRRFGFSL